MRGGDFLFGKSINSLQRTTMSDEKKSTRVPQDLWSPYTEAFDKAVDIVNDKNAPTAKLSEFDPKKLDFYKYFKRATVGKNETPRPGVINQLGRAKWDAWSKLDDITADQAQEQYVKEVLEFLPAGDLKTELEHALKAAEEADAAAKKA
ncbi:acyl-CoA-binding protein [Mycena polygramma]|nr:acyl-CoA-binding protein [Mycena polygramma]